MLQNSTVVCRCQYRPSRVFTCDSAQPAVQESPGVARRVGAQAVAHQVHVAHLPARSDQHVDDEAQLGAHHSGVGDRLVVVGRRGASSPGHDNDIEVILHESKSKYND